MRVPTSGLTSRQGPTLPQILTALQHGNLRGLPHRSRWPLKLTRGRSAAVLVGGFAVAFSGPVAGQTHTGTIVESQSGRPIEGAVVQASPGGYVDVTLSDGRFELLVESRNYPLSVEVTRQGYQTVELTLDRPIRDLVIELEVSPVQLEGISTSPSLEERVAEVEANLDARYGPHRGIFKRLDRDAIRAFDEAHDSDPYAMVTGGLDLMFDFDFTNDVLRTERTRPRSFEVFLDDVRVPLTAMVDVPNEQICRAETFYTSPLLDSDPLREPSPQLRVYTCSFLGRVAAGLETIEDRVCWNELVAWRTPTTLPSGCTYRRSDGR